MNLLCSAYAVKYHDIEYHEKYVVVTQNRTRRRVYKGYFFEDTGTHIYVSEICAGMFQHKHKKRMFMLDTKTGMWEDYQTTIFDRHIPEKCNAKENNIIEELKIC
jgi:hypothetical protein